MAPRIVTLVSAPRARSRAPERVSMRLVSVGAALMACSLCASTGSAQGEPITTSAVLLREAGASAAESAIVSMGLRRGLREVENVRFVHPVDVLSTPAFSEEVQSAIDELDSIADMVRTGDAQYASQRADEIVELFEQNLERVARAQLVDAYMLSAVGRCRAGERRDCERRMGEVITFREGLEYDAARYGDDPAEVFERAQSRTYSSGRGTLVVETVPEGAEIYIDGRSYGPSPVRAEGLLRGGHYVTIKELGHEKRIVRAEVVPGREREERYTLVENPRSRLIVSRETQDALRGELGNARAGDSLRSLGNTLGTTQIMVGVLRPAAGSRVHLQLYLYHVHTRLLQAQAQATLSTDEAGMEQARAVAIELYRGVDLSGGIEAPDDDTGLLGPQAELYEQWWFWVAVVGGAALLVGAISGGVAAGTQDSIPSNVVRIQGRLP